ncbi:MAG: hypothetical protein U9P11_04345 [Pseudomonadota bacterium]|nr:hypothetical protein [Pseudomonadota bacterium]
MNNKTKDVKVDGQDFAVLVESLYVANLLILPVLSFIILVLLFLKKHGSLPPLANSHLEQTISAGFLTAVMLFVATLTIMMMRLVGVEDIALWLIAIILFTIVYAAMLLLGIVGLAKALSGKCWSYPVVGRKLPPGCPK